MKYVAAHFELEGLDDYRVDLLTDELGTAGFDSFSTAGTLMQAYGPAELVDEQLFYSTVKEYFGDSKTLPKLETVQPENWNEVWEKSFEPVIIGNRCAIRAGFHAPVKGVEMEIVITPKMAFGTGHHETTALMGEFLLETYMAGKAVLDMGCGTGVLAVIAAKRGAKYVLAVDYDEICTLSTTENAGVNKVAVEVQINNRVPDNARNFDVVLANINRNILQEQMPQYSAVIKPRGTLFISGFFAGEDLAFLKKAAEHEGFTFLTHKVKGNWAAAAFKKPEGQR